MACNKNEPLQPTNIKAQIISGEWKSDSNFIGIDAASYFALKIDNNYFLNGTQPSEARTIVNEYAINDTTGMPAMYVFNYGNRTKKRFLFITWSTNGHA